MTPGTPRVTIIIPAYNEDERIVPILDRLFESVRLPCEVLVIVDSDTDTTVPVVEEYAQKEDRIRCLVNTYGPGPANAIRFGIDAARAPVAVVTMADGCDDARQIDELARLVERGVAVAAASRYMAAASRSAARCSRARCRGRPGRSLRMLAHVGTRDATNSFKAYSTELRPGGRHRLPRRLRDRHRAHRQGQAARPSGRRDPDDLARPAGRRVQLQGRAVDSQLPALVQVRLRPAHVR